MGRYPHAGRAGVSGWPDVCAASPANLSRPSPSPSLEQPSFVEPAARNGGSGRGCFDPARDVRRRHVCDTARSTFDRGKATGL